MSLIFERRIRQGQTLGLLVVLLCFCAEPMADRLPKTVSVQLDWTHQFQFAGIYAAIEKGLYADAGLEVLVSDGKMPTSDAVESGSVDFGFSGAGLLVKYAEGHPVVALGATFQRSPFTWLVLEESGITSVEDFEGRTLVERNAPHGLMDLTLLKLVDTSSIRLAPFSMNEIDYLVSGDIDAMGAYVSNEPFLLEQRGIAYRQIAPYDFGFDFYGDILFTSRALAEREPELVKAFRDATFEGWRYVAENTGEIVDLVYRKYNPSGKTREHIEFEAQKLLELTLFPTVDFGHMTEDRWRAIAGVYQDLGVIDEIGPLGDFIFREPLVSRQFMRSLVAMLGLLSAIMLVGYLAKERHTAVLQARIREQTASLEAELASRKWLEDSAKREGERLQTLLDNTIDSVITIDQDGTIEGFNHASVALFGYQPEEVLGENVTVLMPERYRAPHLEGMRRFLATEQSELLGRPVELDALLADGREVPIELTISAVKWESQYLFTAVARDISVQKAEQDALLEAKQAAERASEAKSVFLSAMSHELRTPLNSILGFAQLMKLNEQARTGEALRENVQHIMDSGEHLLALINDLLELSKIESGGLSQSIEKVAVMPVIEACMPMLEALATEHEVTLQSRCDSDLLVLADPTRLKQVLINLVSNGIKYNYRGGQVRLVCEAIDGSRLRIKVVDTGRGIPEEQQGQLFVPFKRLGQEYGDIEGSGVGLSISRRLVEAMGGRLDFASIEGTGSCFWVELPLARSVPGQEPESDERQRVAQGGAPAVRQAHN